MKTFGLLLVLVHVALALIDDLETASNAGIDQIDVIAEKLINYKNSVRPKGTNVSAENGGPVIVYVNSYLRRLAEIDGDSMKYDAELTFRQQWKDERLAYDPIHAAGRPYLILTQPGASRKIWTPDTFFQNAVDIRELKLMRENEMILIYPDGTVLFSKRIGLSLVQSLDFEQFPFDVHDLKLEISSYAHDEKDIVYKWRADWPIQVNTAAVQDPRFKLNKVLVKNFTQPASLGHYSSLRAIFEVQRRASRTKQFQIFGPSFILVIVSWLPLIISTPSLLVRAVITLSALMTIILQIATIGGEIPDTPKTTWAHVWLITCFVFIVAAQFQLIAYSWLMRVRASRCSTVKPKSKKEQTEEQWALASPNGKCETGEEAVGLFNFGTVVDFVCLSVFIVAFFVFNCYYWTATSPGADIVDAARGTIVYDAN